MKIKRHLNSINFATSKMFLNAYEHKTDVTVLVRLTLENSSIVNVYSFPNCTNRKLIRGNVMNVCWIKS